MIFKDYKQMVSLTSQTNKPDFFFPNFPADNTKQVIGFQTSRKTFRSDEFFEELIGTGDFVEIFRVRCEPEL